MRRRSEGPLFDKLGVYERQRVTESGFLFRLSKQCPEYFGDLHRGPYEVLLWHVDADSIWANYRR